MNTHTSILYLQFALYLRLGYPWNKGAVNGKQFWGEVLPGSPGREAGNRGRKEEANHCDGPGHSGSHREHMIAHLPSYPGQSHQPDCPIRHWEKAAPRSAACLALPACRSAPSAGEGKPLGEHLQVSREAARVCSGETTAVWCGRTLRTSAPAGI